MMLLALLAATCFPLAGPTITAQDIAHAVPGYTPHDASVLFGYSPMPGVQRVVHPAEVQQFLKHEAYSGAMPTGNFCFERPTALLTEQAVKGAMQSVLGSEAHIEIVEISRFPAPPGAPVFSRGDLGAPPIALWRGYVLYDGNKKFPVWARVKITVRVARVMAVEDLKPGTPIRPEQVALQTAEDFPGTRVTPSSIGQVTGALPRRYINAHTPVWEDSIDPPNQVSKGDRVSVMVLSGRARLLFDAEAETDGRRGEVVSLKNPESGKLFRARINGPDQASIEAPGGQP